MSAPASLIWCPFPSEDEARAVASALLDEELVACANIIPGMISLYEWDGDRGEAREVGVLFKSHPSCIAELLPRLAQLHSYKSPAIMHWDASASPDATINWLGGLGTGGPQSGQG